MSKSPSTVDNTVDLKKARLIASHREMMRRWQDADDVFVRLARRLQTTLEVEKQLDIFCQELDRVVSVHSLVYQHGSDYDQLVYTRGQGGQHHCIYTLSLKGEALGTLEFYSRSRFAEEELQVIEQLIGVLIHPLKNGWQYRAALNAALTDAITQLGNKRAMEESMQHLIAFARRQKEPLTLILCDLDHFKSVNDNYGHLFGDQALADIGEVIKRSVRTSDQCFRYGGEEFAVLLPHTDAKAAEAVAERIRETIERHAIAHQSGPVKLTVSLGLAELGKSSDPNVLIHDADAALYEAKRQGRNRLVSAQIEG
ncbi:GGDEF domain-containing protein [Marinobacteraceae bacterium S3BR75-40.1]